MPIFALADQLLIGHKAQEGVTKARARDPMLLGDDAPGRGLTIGKGEEDYALVAIQPIPHRLVRIRSLRQGVIDGRRGRIA